MVKNEVDSGISVCDLSTYTNVHHLVEKLINPELLVKTPTKSKY
ncbi:MAG: hypothetical protein QG635_1628 [Bacteroidota bacterium]|nr:hypothetical protein [Bacteroidota bacterium]